MQDASISPAQMTWVQERLKVENQFKNGASWFFWIAGLSIVNSLAYYAGVSWSFVIGLGVTQFIDGFAGALARRGGSNAGLFFTILGFVLDLLIGGLFIVFGLLGRKKYRWAFIVGMVLYALDALIFLALQLWLGLIFHALALSGLYAGFSAIGKLTGLPELPPSSPLQPFPKWAEPASALAAEIPDGAAQSLNPGRPLRVRHWPIQAIGWGGLIFFGFIAVVCLFNNGGWATLVFIGFAALSTFLIVGYGTTEMDGEKVSHKNMLGRYQILWSEIRQIEYDAGGSNLVLQGDQKELVVSGPYLWFGRDKK